MINAELLRVFKRPDGTFSILTIEDMPLCLSVERQWLNNQVGVSCIPTGLYLCRRVQSPKFGDTFEVTNVSGRTAILFHSGNVDDDSHGCIILGESFEPWKDGTLSVQSSRTAFDEFRNRLKDVDQFQLQIREINNARQA